jgi:hypothetical protein
MTRKISYQELRSALLRSVFRRPSNYAALCERSWTISPAESRVERSAIYLEGELERVRGVQENTTLDAEVQRVASGMRRHAETKAYQFRNVRLLGGRLFKGAMSHRMSQLADHADAAEEVAMPSVAVGSTLMGSIYFGHWLRDDASLHVAVQSLAPTIDIARQPYSHERGYRELLSLPEQRVARGRFDELILLDDWGQNADKRRRYQELRARFRRAIPANGSDRIYIKRGRATGARGRDLLNAEEIEAHLVAQGFAVVDPDKMAVDQIARISNGAKLIVGLEGSHLAHAIYPIADDGTLLVLQPPFRFNNVYKDLSDAMGLDYAFIVGDAAEGGFTIDLDRLDRLLDRLT